MIFDNHKVLVEWLSGEGFIKRLYTFQERAFGRNREAIVNTELKVMFRLVESSEKALASDSISMEKQDTKQFGYMTRSSLGSLTWVSRIAIIVI